MPILNRNEKTLLFAHYDYFTGRAVRTLLNLEETTANIDSACACLIAARKERCKWQSKHAKKMALDCYNTWKLRLTDLQLKVVDTLAHSPPGKLHSNLLEVLERELTKKHQPELPTT